eukprot:6187108-Pleurochrysis_carterae.AAC.1
MHSARNVLRRLRGTDSLNAEKQAVLLQAHVRALNERGHYVRLLTADARTVRVLILQQAENRYNIVQRRKRAAAEEHVGPDFNPKLVKLPQLADRDEAGKKCHYVVGWVFCPAYMRKQLRHFPPVDAVDAGHFKGAGTGAFNGKGCWDICSSGTLFVRSTLDANRCVHAAAVAHILSGECLWGYYNLMAHEQKAYGDDIQGSHRVTIVDGGIALNRSLQD